LKGFALHWKWQLRGFEKVFFRARLIFTACFCLFVVIYTIHNVAIFERATKGIDLQGIQKNQVGFFILLFFYLVSVSLKALRCRLIGEMHSQKNSRYLFKSFYFFYFLKFTLPFFSDNALRIYWTQKSTQYSPLAVSAIIVAEYIVDAIALLTILFLALFMSSEGILTAVVIYVAEEYSVDLDVAILIHLFYGFVILVITLLSSVLWKGRQRLYIFAPNFSISKLLLIIFLSILSWIILISGVSIFMAGLRVLDLYASILYSALLLIFNSFGSLIVNTPAQIGSFEVISVFILNVMELEQVPALTNTFLVHASLILCQLVLLLFIFWAFSGKK